MERLKSIYYKLSKTLKFSITDPKNFKEILSFKSNLIRVLSLLFLLLLITAIFSILFINGFDSFFYGQDKYIKRNQLESQREKIEELYSKIKSQESYIRNIKSILNNEVQSEFIPNISSDSIIEVDVLGMDSKQTLEEKVLSKKVKDDMSTGLSATNKAIVYFGNPAIGVVSQEFNLKNHPGIDIVTERDYVVRSCLAGTIVYTGFTRKDGHIAIIEHHGGYISIYKHNKRVLKKTGAKVQLGDPISIVGNTGENSDGPHLHFELWHDQTAVNPKEYMSFKN